MGSQGTTTVNFGAFPGSVDTSVAVTGQASILSGSLVEAWIFPSATADHSADEHMLEPFKVIAGNVVAATGFTIYAFTTSTFLERPTEQQSPSPVDAGGVGVAANYLGRVGQGSGVQGRSTAPAPADNSNNGKSRFLYGQFTVAWVWN